MRAWIEGVLAQALNAGAAARTRPWVLNEQRLADLFPDQHQASVDRLVGLLHEPITQLWRKPAKDDVCVVATLVYQLTFATLRTHLVAGTKPDPRRERIARGILSPGSDAMNRIRRDTRP